MNVFDNGVGGTISGVFGGDDNDDTIVFSSVGADDMDGFIIEGYTLSWQRGLQYRRAYNKKGNIVVVGKGTGSLSLTGLVGPADEFERLVESTSGKDVCKNANCTISAGGGYSSCDSSGNTSTSSKNITITAKSIILQGLSISGQMQEGAVTLTQANMTFKVGGVAIE